MNRSAQPTTPDVSLAIDIESNKDATEQSEVSPPDPGVTFRVVVICILLALLFGYAMPITNYKLSNTFLGASHLPAGGIATLLLLLFVLNPALRLFSKRRALSRNETLTIYISCLFSSLVPGRGGENFFVPNILATFYYATYENQWFERISPYVKPWITPALNTNGSYNATVTAGWYVGGESIPWGAWLVPLIAWTLIIFALYAMLACLAVLLRAQWAEREALTFPLLRLPLEMTFDMDSRSPREQLPFFRNPLMWLGCGTAVFIETLNGLSLYFPNVPQFPLEIPTTQMLTEVPWSQMGPFSIRVWVVVVGISYLLSTEVAFSLWFFFLFHKFQNIVIYTLGLPMSTLPNYPWARSLAKPFISYQQTGAYTAYVVLLLWMGRAHFGHILSRAVGRAPATAAEDSEALSYPVAFWGFVLSLAFVIGWLVAAGAQIEVAAMMWAGYLITAMGLTRVVAETGLVMVHAGWGPHGPLMNLIGPWIAPASGIPSSLVSSSLMTEMRGFLLPSYLHSYKLAHDRGIAARPLLALITAVTVISFAVGLWTILWMGYSQGALTMDGWWARGSAPKLTGLMSKEILDRSPRIDYFSNWGWFGFGALLTWGLTILRARFDWFPLHPIGYMLFASHAIYSMWFSVFLAWLAKLLVLRFGGSDAYRKTIPLFLGLALGDFVMMAFWVLVDGWLGRTGHYLLPL